MKGIIGRLTRIGVDMGDHGQDVHTYHEVDPNETVQALTERLLGAYRRGGLDHTAGAYLTLVLVEPIEQPPPQ